MCHIIPFAANADPRSITRQRNFIEHLRLYLDPAERNLFMDLQIFSGPGGADKSWNMLCLSPMLHDWWSRSLFGLKVCGQRPSSQGTKSTLTLQFHWFQQHKLLGMDPVQATREEIERMIAVDYTSGGDGCEVTNEATGRKIQTGDCIEIEMAHDEIRNMACMLKLVWHLSIAVRLRGQAPVPDNFEDHDQDDREDAGAFAQVPDPEVLDWLHDVDAQRNLQRK